MRFRGDRGAACLHGCGEGPEKAKAASYDLYAAKLTLDDADEEYKDKAGDLGYNKDNYEYIAVKHRWQAAQYTYNAAVQNFELSFRSLYDRCRATRAR